MLFNTLAFALFLPTVLLLYWILPRRLRVGLLLVASYVFYSWWDVRFLSLIVISTLTDYLVGRRLATEKRSRLRKSLLLVSLVVNLGVLAFFKYWGFFVESASSVLVAIGVQPNASFISVVLPVGISFYTFQTLSYTIDVYRDRVEPEESITRFALFVAFFPQLVAGPIERANRLLPQLRSLPSNTREVAWGESVTLIARGLFRKVVIADGLAPIVDQVFADPASYAGLTISMGVLAFSLQIYGDFAGYTDIARGTAKLFGVDLMENFRAPYSSRSFSEFWRRWHMSLSTWLRDYLYIPLGGNRGSRLATYRNLTVTMLLGGLWHGAGWGFVIWGGLHGLYLMIERVWRERPQRSTRVKPQRLPALVVFGVVTLTWIPFRSPSFGTALEVAAGLFQPLQGAQMTAAPVVLALLGFATLAIDRGVLRDLRNPVGEFRPLARGVAYGVAIALVPLFATEVADPFIYFQF